MESIDTDLSHQPAAMPTSAVAEAATAGVSGTDASTEGARSIARLFYTDTGVAGARQTVMLLHGWTCDSHDWSWQLPALESKYRVIAVDLRGHGRSEVMPPGSYMPHDYVADIEALIANQLRGEKLLLMGHSMGAQVAARLALKRPDLVSAVVSVDGSLGFSDELTPIYEKTVDELMAGDPGAVAPALFGLFYGPNTDPAHRRWHARRAQGLLAHVVRESFGPLLVGPGQVGVGAASAEFCSRLTVPVYHLCTDGAQADRMRPWFRHPKSKVDVWTEAGHWIMLDRTEDVNAAVTAWIDAL